MEIYRTLADAKPTKVVKAVMASESTFPFEPYTIKVFKNGAIHENCLCVYDQEKHELHYYNPIDWILSNSVFDSLRLLGYVPIGERYPFYADNQENTAINRLEEIYKKLNSVWEEEKKDITDEELKQEVEKISTPPLTVYSIFGNMVLDDPRSENDNITPFFIETIKKKIEELLPITTEEKESRNRFWVKSGQCPDKRLYMEQYADKKYPFIHVTDVGEEVLLIPDKNNYFYLYFNFKHEQRFEEKGNGVMVDKKCHPFYKLSPSCKEYGVDIEKFKSSRLKKLLTDEYIATWNGSEFEVYPKSFTWEKSEYIPASSIPNQGWVTNIYKKKI